jgi:hypothetical protein
MPCHVPSSCQLSRLSSLYTLIPSHYRILSQSMAVAYPLPHASAETVQNIKSLLKFTILAVIAAAAIASRLFAVIRHESIIHEL